MKNNIFKKIFTLTNLLICLFIICFFFLNTGIKTTDDYVYKNAFNNFPTFTKWIIEYYNLWSGRITIAILVSVFNKLPTMFFKVTNTSVFVISILLMYKIVSIIIENWDEKFKNIALISLFCSIFLIGLNTINSGCLWIAGAINYLWPFTTMLVSIIPFIAMFTDKRIPTKYYVFAIISNGIACFAEQTSAILLAFGTISIMCCIIEKRKINKLIIIHFIIIIVLSLMNLLAPGNMVRSHVETMYWNQNFELLTFTDKLMQGYLRIANHLINDNTIILLIITMLSSYCIIMNAKVRKINKFLTIIPVIYLLLKMLSRTGIIGDIVDQKLFSFGTYNIETLYNEELIITLILSSYIIAIVGIQLIWVFLSPKTGIVVTILYYASICSTIVMGFSPTVYASGNRTFTVTDFLLVLISGILWVNVFSKQKGNVVFKILMTEIIILSFISYMNIYMNGISRVIY